MSMPTNFTLEIVTPERQVLKEDGVHELSAPGWGGYFGVLPAHAPYLVMLSEGVLSYRKGSSWQYLSVLNGFAEILGDKVTVLAEKCEKGDEIDLKRAEDSRKRAEERLKKHSEGEETVDFDRARLALMRSIIRIKTKSSSKY